MPILKPENVLDVARDPERAVDETSDESFDRTAFAREALDLVRPPRTTVAICPGAARMRVESGRTWGRGRRAAGADGGAVDAREADERWAMIAIPPRASRRAIALAVAELARLPRPYVLDILLGA